jgi:hypothetical protein
MQCELADSLDSFRSGVQIELISLSISRWNQDMYAPEEIIGNSHWQLELGNDDLSRLKPWSNLSAIRCASCISQGLYVSFTKDHVIHI